MLLNSAQCNDVQRQTSGQFKINGCFKGIETILIINFIPGSTTFHD